MKASWGSITLQSNVYGWPKYLWLDCSPEVRLSPCQMRRLAAMLLRAADKIQKPKQPKQPKYKCTKCSDTGNQLNGTGGDDVAYVLSPIPCNCRAGKERRSS
jgi:hypothetical protein